MRSEISEANLMNIKYFSDHVENLIKYREKLNNYLKNKIYKLSQNTSALIMKL